MPRPLLRTRYRRLVLVGAGVVAFGGAVAAAASGGGPDPVAVELAAHGADDASSSSAHGASSPVTVDDSPSSTPATTDDSSSSSTPGSAGSVPVTVDDDETSTSTPTSAPEPAIAPFTKTYALAGGTVVVSSNNGRTLVLASVTTRAGFDVDVKHGGGDRVEVRFESDDHESRLRVEIENGRLDEEIEERVD
jgi:hypothetical protein